MYQDIIDRLATQGWAVCENFIDESLVQQLVAEEREMLANGKFREAGIGKGDSFQVRPEIRGDEVRWLDQDFLTESQQRYWDKIDVLRQQLNQECYLGLKTFEFHFTHYPKGAFYKKHLDQFRQVRYRIISCVLYLNENWQEGDGGKLRIYLPDGSEEDFVDIAPKAGTLACFRSEDIHHEVLPTNVERYSLTGWLRRDA